MDDYTISWVAPEHDHHEHSADWYWAVGIISFSLAVAFVILGNMLLSIIIVLGMGTLLAFAKHPPRNLEYQISKKGVRRGTTLYPWDTLESFWIIDGKENVRYPHSPKLLLVSKKPLMPHIVITLTEAVIDEVQETLAQMLHEVPQAEPLPDRLMRIIGF
ncbi:MAG: hypothetical protein Q7K40_03810 [bacterium]|nr:hypothetical protein [bacterium]